MKKIKWDLSTVHDVKFQDRCRKMWVKHSPRAISEMLGVPCPIVMKAITLACKRRAAFLRGTVVSPRP